MLLSAPTPPPPNDAQEARLVDLSPLTWPEVARRALLFGPLGATARAHAAPAALRAAAALADGDYSRLPARARIALLKGLVDAASATCAFAEHLDRRGAELESELQVRAA